MVNSERLEEKWFTFYRYSCTEGFIDIWMGDSADNPNSEFRSRWNLNSFSTYIRLNGEDKWYPDQFRRGTKGLISEMAENSTSLEIWNELRKDNYEE